MSNFTLKRGELKNIQGVAVKKLKLKATDFENLKLEGEKLFVTEPVIEEKSNEFEKFVQTEKELDIRPIVEEPKQEESVPSFLSKDDKSEKYSFDEVALKEKIAGKYGNLANLDKKEDKKTEPEEHKITEAEFEKLLSTDAVIMKDKIDKFRQVFNEKQNKLKQDKLDDAKYADSFQKTSNEEQVAKADREVKKKRTSEMKNAANFTYLEIGKDEDSRIVEAVRVADEALKNLYNVNQIVSKELDAKIEQYQNDKKEINRASEKIRFEIRKDAEDLNKFMKEKAPILEDIISVNAKYKDAEAESEKAIRDEYEALTKLKETNVNQVEQNIVSDQPVQIPNAMENFKKVTAVQGMNDSLIGINDLYTDNMANENIIGGRGL